LRHARAPACGSEVTCQPIHLVHFLSTPNFFPLKVGYSIFRVYTLLIEDDTKDGGEYGAADTVDNEQVAVATVDGIATLVVPDSEERARGLIGAASFEGMEARPATVEGIEAVCAHSGLGSGGLFGLDDGRGLDVLSVEVHGMVLEAS